MTNMESTFTSTGFKLMRHPGVIKNIMENGKATPVSLQVSPTSRCNLKCSFCSNANREKHEDLDSIKLIQFIRKMTLKGLKTVEYTGGGDPTCYGPINEVIKVSRDLGLEQGFITNGVELSKLTEVSINSLSWLRISMNCLDYIDSIEIPDIKGVLGFSYVMNEKTDHRVLDRLKRYTKVHEPAYVRIVPDCQTTLEEQEENNRRYSSSVGEWGHPFFYQVKNFSRPERCWWGYIKPFLYNNSYIYPCSSVVLNDDSEGQFHEKYKWSHMDDFIDCYRKKMVPFDTNHCNHCVFAGQNEIIDSLLCPSGMSNFI